MTTEEIYIMKKVFRIITLICICFTLVAPLGTVHADDPPQWNAYSNIDKLVIGTVVVIENGSDTGADPYIRDGDGMTLHYKWHVDNANYIKNGDMYSIALPSGPTSYNAFTSVQELWAEVADVPTLIGTWQINSTNRTIELTFNDYFEQHPEITKLEKGYITLGGNIRGTGELVVTDEYSYTVHPHTTGDINNPIVGRGQLFKLGGQLTGENRFNWLINFGWDAEIASLSGASDMSQYNWKNVVVTDIMDPSQMLIDTSVNIRIRIIIRAATPAGVPSSLQLEYGISIAHLFTKYNAGTVAEIIDYFKNGAGKGSLGWGYALNENAVVIWYGDMGSNGLRYDHPSIWPSVQSMINRSSLSDAEKERTLSMYAGKAIYYNYIDGIYSTPAPTFNDSTVTNTATVTYDGGDDISSKRTVDFTRMGAGIEGVPVGTVRIEKSDADGNPMSGVKFSLQVKNGAIFEPMGVGYTDIATDANGVVEFSGLVVGNTYKIVETTPTGYLDEATIYINNVLTPNAEFTCVAGATYGFLAEIINYPLPDDIEVDLSATKSLLGRNIKEDEFQFGLFGADASFNADATAIETVTNAADGSVSFSPLIYTSADIGSTFYYVIKEIVGTDPTITYNSKEIGVRVEISLSSNKELVADVTYVDNTTESKTPPEFINTYTRPGDITASFQVNKSLTGRKLVEDEFQFGLYRSDASYNEEATPIRTARNNASGLVVFDPVIFTADDVGIHYFVIKEIAGTDPRIKYSTEKIGVKVVVLLGANGQLDITVTYDQDGVERSASGTIENTYTPPRSPKTNDNNHIGLYIALMFACVGLVSIAEFRRRRNSKASF
jgi:streptococcal pilin isopeptide linkage domain